MIAFDRGTETSLFIKSHAKSQLFLTFKYTRDGVVLAVSNMDKRICRCLAKHLTNIRRIRRIAKMRRDHLPYDSESRAAETRYLTFPPKYIIVRDYHNVFIGFS